MDFNLITKVFGSRNDRLLKQYGRIVSRINSLESSFETISDEALRAKTVDFQSRLKAGEDLEALLPEAFAVVREGSKRVMKMRHFDVQLLGGIALHEGKIAEMRTGEGKTLTATLPVYLNALGGHGVHVVTVNDYLAQRDAEWMARLYNFLGLSVGINLPNLPKEKKQNAYQSDITYGTNNEYGFDYLRDNMVFNSTDRVQRPLNFAIVDEVDSILIDEARTPLIISGQAEDHTDTYRAMTLVAPLLVRQEGEEDLRTGQGVTKPGDFTVDEKARQIFLTEKGHETAELLLAERGLLPAGTSLYDPSNILLMHHLYAALRAEHLYHRDQHYVVQQGEIVIVDEFTGRLMTGRRWSEGLHQAVESKENVDVQAENQTMASITFQNYFRLYEKLSGMTGTADTEAYEFQEIYGLETIVIPPNQPSKRNDQLDRVYKSTKEKYSAAIADIRECYDRGQPVLVGTTSIENSEILSDLLQRESLPHQVLNAKQHEREAEIVSQAGRPKMITIATNMAGRGTDIVLGGNLEKMLSENLSSNVEFDHSNSTAINAQEITTRWEKDHAFVNAQGGLRIIATERHESRRIDNQLRGRSGRQGDPGSSRFYLSLDDTLMRIFAGDRVRSIMDRLKMPDGEAIEAGIVSRSIESAQRKVEGRNFDMRKQLLEYDDVSNDQRKVIYLQRNEILDSVDLSETVTGLRRSCFEDVVNTYVPIDSVEEQWSIKDLEQTLSSQWGVTLDLIETVKQSDALDAVGVKIIVLEAADQIFESKVAMVGGSNFTEFERAMLLQNIDSHWRDHLASLDYLRQGIHLRGYAQKQPKQEYKREAFELFSQMLDAIKFEVTKTLMTVEIENKQELKQLDNRTDEVVGISKNSLSKSSDDSELTLNEMSNKDEVINSSDQNIFDRVSRNDPCPCGSGQRYKNCHGLLV